MATDPFHEGEKAMQSSIGMREPIAAIGSRVIRDHMPEQHIELFERLPTLFVGTLDGEGQPWATVVVGPPGFVQSPEDRSLRVAARPSSDDPASAGLRPGASVGLLGIEPHTRRRNRANGLVVASDESGFTVHIHQSFGNCPKYIQGRRPAPRPGRRPEAAEREGARLGDDARALVERSDTMFIASSSAARLDAHDLSTVGGAGVDVSHRGGKPGFVAIERSDTGDRLIVPDYAGNAMFNTLGNLLLWPRAGLLFLDFVEGHALQLATTAEIRAEDPALDRFPGAERLLVLTVQGGWLRRAAVPLAWESTEPPARARARAP
ncbi:MAG: pyridoxamine 5'-phosphate oxidase family protein [Deltaproteobacteria bacterium]|nr:pyridoxamine 5'-phosphate oxidase family protein [Deltaproteobacteria bacterium]